MQTHTIELETADGPMSLYEVVPDANARGAIVVLQEAYGVNEYIEGVARSLAEHGYQAVAPHLFHRTGGGVVPYGDMARAIEMIGTLSDDALLIDIDAALEHVRAAGFSDPNIGIVGFCMGGRATFLAAARRPLGAGVGFYGGAIVGGWPPKFAALDGEAPKLKAPWLGLFGEQDRSIPAEHVERLRTALESAPVDTEIVTYPNAGHGFHCDRRESFSPDAAADGWRRAIAWFDQHIVR